MTRGFTRFAAGCAFVAAAGSLVYAISFLIVLEDGSEGAAKINAACLLLGGLISPVVYVALFERLRQTDSGFAVVALVFGAAGGIGAAMHGGFDLANLLKPPADPGPGLPNQADPRGLATFLFAAIAIFIFAALMRSGGQFPRGLSAVGLVGAALLVVVYVGRLTVLRPKAPVLFVALILAGFLSGPIWFLWIGITLGSERRPAVAAQPSVGGGSGI